MVIKKNILVTGANGQLGSSIKEIETKFEYKFFFTNKKQLDITRYSLVEKFIRQKNINIIINCAAHTNLEMAEQNKSHSENINHLAVENLAQLCFNLGIQLIHISTDFIFDGLKNKPYTELDITRPQNHYGICKYRAEEKILSYKLKNSAIIRTSWLYSKVGNNFVNKILNKLKDKKEIFVVEDEIGSPTNAKDLAMAIMTIIPRLSNNKTEIFHFSNLGFCSRFEFASKITELISSKVDILPTNEAFSKVKRPKFSALDSSKIIRTFKLEIESWENSLETFLINNKI